MSALHDIDLLKREHTTKNLRIPMYAATTCVLLDADAYIKNGLTYGMSVRVIQSMGSRRHSDLVKKAAEGEVGNFKIIVMEHNCLKNH